MYHTLHTVLSLTKDLTHSVVVCVLQMAACIPGKVGRAQGLDLEPVRLDLHATVKPAL